ncbi:MAG: molybdopterin molybdotransferase MoeA [Burkholderiaceae bacterium]|nr:molybdopterin molybdotransferase MoeA [Microbacteriaceae bacterium]
MTAWSTARDRALELGLSRPHPLEIVDIADAAGRTLGVDLAARAPLPGYSSSAMDGWVVAGEQPWRIGTAIHAGDSPDLPDLVAGTARPIMTGGPVPPGSRGVLRLEHGTELHDAEQHDTGTATGPLLVRNTHAQAEEPHEGAHIRLIGEELAEGAIVITAGSVLTPPRVALAAVAGHDAVTVTARPRVAFVLLGSEVVTSGIPASGLVRDAYSPQFPDLARSLGLLPVGTRRVTDDLAATIDAITDAGDADLIVTTGGTARGATDHVRAALETLGATLVLDGVAMRPGHPVMLATLPDGRPVLCLPGNPLAAMLALLSIGGPLVDGLLGRPVARLGRTVTAVKVPNPGRQTRLVAAVFTDLGAEPTASQGSGMLRGLAAADTVLVVPPGGLAAGVHAATLPLPW